MSVPHRLRILALALSLLAARLDAAENQKQSVRTEKPIVYNHVGKGSARSYDTKAKALYRDKFKIVDFSDERGYIRSKVTRKLIPRPALLNGRPIAVLLHQDFTFK